MLTWHMSVIVAKKNGAWESTAVWRDNNGFFQIGPDVSTLPEIVEFLQSLDLESKQAVAVPGNRDVQFRFTAQLDNCQQCLIGGTNNTRITDRSTTQLKTQLVEEPYFTEYFLGESDISGLAMFDLYRQITPYRMSIDENGYRVGASINPFGRRSTELNEVFYTKNGSTIYAVISYYSEPVDVGLLYTLNIDTGAMTYVPVECNLRRVSAIDWHPGINKFVMLLNNDLYTLGLSGDAVLIRNGIDAVDLTYNPNNGKILGSDGSSEVYEIDIETGDLSNFQEIDFGDYAVDDVYRIHFCGTTCYLVAELGDVTDVEGIELYLGTLNTSTWAFTKLLRMDTPYIRVVNNSPLTIMTYDTDNDEDDIIPDYALVKGVRNGDDWDYTTVKELSRVPEYDAGAMGYNPDDKKIYVLEVIDRNVTLKKYDTTTFTGVDVTLPASATARYINSAISDGGGDMYDTGNIMSTNRLLGIEYSHTPQVNNFDAPQTGTVVTDGIAFGPGSSYYTALYEACFLLVAHDISITSFEIDGNLGADGSGTATGGEFNITSGGTTYRCFYKKVYGAGDPSVNHLIIIPENVNASHSYSTNTDHDTDTVTGLDGTSKLYYLVFATQSGGNVALQKFQDVATTFLGKFTNATSLETIRTTFSGGAMTDVTANLTNPFTFTDASDATVVGGLNSSDPGYMVYIGDGKFFASVDEEYRIVGENLFESISLDNDGIQGIAKVGDTIYGVDGGIELYTIDLETGGTEEYLTMGLPGLGHGEGENIYGIETIFTYENQLYGFAEYQGDRYLITINHLTGDVALVGGGLDGNPDIPVVLGISGSTNAIAFSDKKLNSFAGTYDIDEGNNFVIYATVAKWPTLPTMSNMVAQWCYCPNIIDERIEDSVWHNTDILQIGEFLEEYQEQSVTIAGATRQMADLNVVLRIRYTNDNSGNWAYYIWND